MATITTADVRSFIAARQRAEIVTGKGDERKVRNPSNAEINRELATLKRIFTLAIQGGKLLHRPHIPMLRENNVRTGFFELEQFQAVRSRLPAAIQPVATFAYCTGWRIASEVLPLQWRQVSFTERTSPEQLIAGTVRLDAGTTKNGDGRVFPFTEELRDLLLEQKREADRLKAGGVICPYVFHRSTSKTKGKKITSFIKAWRNACIAACCPGRIPHDLRRTAVRNLVRRGVPERVAMLMTGHKTRSVFERYNVVSSSDLAQAANRLNATAQTAR
jgi:integrase